MTHLSHFVDDQFSHHLLADSSLKLLDALAKDKGLDNIINIGYQLLGNPILIIDMSMKTIAYVPNNSKVDDDPVWNEYVETGYASLNLVHYYAMNKLAKKINESHYPFFWSDPYSKYPRIMSNVFIGDKQVALLSVVAHEKPFQKRDLELTDLLAKAVSIELQKDHFSHFTRGLLHESFLQELLDGKLKDEQIINDRIKALNITLKKNLYVLTFDINHYNSSSASLTYFRNELEQKIPHSKAFIYNNQIVLLVSYDDNKQMYQKEIRNLKRFLNQYELYAGISRSFYKLVAIQEHFFQSLNALRLGQILNKDEYLYRYEDYAIYHVAELLSNYENPLRNCHPAVLYLLEHDKGNNTDYTRSLYAYIAHAKNITESAKALNIHRNTMLYRIEKIQSMIGADLNNHNTLLHLHLSFKILEVLKIDLP